MSQPGQTALQEFFRWESQSWVEVVGDLATDEKARFMPVQNLRTYFTANNSNKLNKILVEVFKSEFPPIDADFILRDHTAVFCILLRIGRGEYIEHFARYEELSDRRLPFDPTHPPAEFLEAEDDAGFLQSFCDKQRMYCVPILDGHMLHKHFGRQRLLPITHKESRGMEGAAEKYVVKLYGPHNKLLPPGQDPQIKNTFVLKRYQTKTEKESYTEEVNGFRSVKHVDSIIRFYGSYIHGDTSNVLLESADRGSLEEYFKNENPPSRGTDIIKLWENLFQLIKALKAIHSVRDGHHGVTPENVVVLSNGEESSSDWQFKFANFGLPKIKSKFDSLQEGETPSDGKQRTSTYAPPESYTPYHSDGSSGRTPSKITWTADIWSLGCIYSEAAMWIADGYKGLLDYRKQRMAESDRILFKAGDCFHDGERILQSVQVAHSEIEDRLRRSDYVTKDVLDSLVDEMLWEDDRPNAKALSRKADMVLSRARQRLSANSGEEFSRSGSSQGGRNFLPPRLPPPTQALPPIPKNLPPGLSSITEKQPPNVEKWRAQISASRRSQFSANGSDTASPTLSAQQLNPNRRSPPSDVGDKDFGGSTASWQLADERSRFGDNSSVTSPDTPVTSPHVSMQFDFLKHTNSVGQSNGQTRMHNQIQQDERPRVLRSHASSEFKVPPRSLSRGLSYKSNGGSTTSDYTAPPKYPGPGSYVSYSPIVTKDTILSPQSEGNGGPPFANQSITPPPDNGYTPSAKKPTVRPSINSGPPSTNQNTIPSPPASSAPSQVSSQNVSSSTVNVPQYPANSNPSSIAPQQSIDEFRGLTRAASKASSRNSSAPSVPYSQAQTILSEAPSYQRYPEEQARPKSSKRGLGFSLFPSKSKASREDPPPLPKPESIKESRKAPVAPYQLNIASRGTDMFFTQFNDYTPKPKSVRSSISGPSGGKTPSVFSDSAGGFEYLSLNTCLEWKKAHKKVKKASKVPPLPGAYMLDSLNDRDHIFIIDDGASMEPVWPEVKRVFDALSYTVKGMSPDGTELFFTVAYDTYRRKDTTDLCDYLEKKGTAGETDICYRLNLQLQSYQAKIYNSKGLKGKKAIVRPMSFYILTNGEWGKLPELKKLIRETADFLKKQGLGKGQVTIEFISFAQSAAAGQVMNDLENEDFGMDIVDCTRWTGNVLKMLRGPLDKHFSQTNLDPAVGYPVHQ